MTTTHSINSANKHTSHNFEDEIISLAKYHSSREVSPESKGLEKDQEKDYNESV